jgi:acetyl-CoA acetyltransferase
MNAYVNLLLLQDPELMAAMQDPEVMAALSARKKPPVSLMTVDGNCARGFSAAYSADSADGREDVLCFIRWISLCG